MKPVSINNLSAFGYIGLLILFNIPGIGFPAMVILSIIGEGEVKSFSRACLIIIIAGFALLYAFILFGIFGIEQILPDMIPGGGIEVFRYISSFIG